MQCSFSIFRFSRLHYLNSINRVKLNAHCSECRIPPLSKTFSLFLVKAHILRDRFYRIKIIIGHCIDHLPQIFQILAHNTQ